MRDRCLVIIPKCTMYGSRRYTLYDTGHRQGKELRGGKARNKYRHTMLLHNLQELDNHLRAGSDQNLALARLLGIVDRVERIIQDAGFDHLGVVSMRFSALKRGEVSAW